MEHKVLNKLILEEFENNYLGEVSYKDLANITDVDVKDNIKEEDMDMDMDKVEEQEQVLV